MPFDTSTRLYSLLAERIKFPIRKEKRSDTICIKPMLFLWWTKRCCKRTAIILVLVSVSAISIWRSTALSAIAVIKRPIFYVIRRIEDDFDLVFVEINFLDKGIDEYLFVSFFADVQESKRNEELIALIHGDLLSFLVSGFQ